MYNLLLILLILFLLYKIFNYNEKFNEENKLTDDNNKKLTDDNNKKLTDDNNKKLTDDNNKKLTDDNNKKLTDDNNKKICCLYAYYEKDNKYKENFEYFLANGIYDEIDYYLIINGPFSINIPERKNIIIFNRENKGYDFGAWSYGLKNITKEYDYYTFINTSVKGPYLYNTCEKWYEPFMRLFNNDVKIVGTTVNIYKSDDLFGIDLTKIYNKENPFTHVQSMFFIIDKEYLNYLNTLDFFNETKLNNITEFFYLIGNYEIGLSQHALIKGWNINCILQPYRNQDFRILKNGFLTDGGDLYYNGRYFGKTIDPYDVVFFKTNRF